MVHRARLRRLQPDCIVRPLARRFQVLLEPLGEGVEVVHLRQHFIHVVVQVYPPQPLQQFLVLNQPPRLALEPGNHLVELLDRPRTLHRAQYLARQIGVAKRPHERVVSLERDGLAETVIPLHGLLEAVPDGAEARCPLSPLPQPVAEQRLLSEPLKYVVTHIPDAPDAATLRER